MSTPEFPIPLSDLDAGGKEFRFTLRPAWVRGALEDHEAKASKREGAVVVRASKSGHDVVVRGALDAVLSMPCARCLEPFDLPIHAELSVLYVPAGQLKAPKDADYEFAPEEADTLPFEGETVALDDLVRDELILEIPMIPLCSDACPGISPAPGVEGSSSEEKTIDPRLAPLLRFGAKPTKS